MSVIPDKVWAMSESSRSEGATNLNLAFAELLEEIRRLELKACPDVDIRDHDAFRERLLGADRTRQPDSTLTQHMTTAARVMALEILERKSNSPAALAALGAASPLVLWTCAWVASGDDQLSSEMVRIELQVDGLGAHWMDWWRLGELKLLEHGVSKAELSRPRALLRDHVFVGARSRLEQAQEEWKLEISQMKRSRRWAMASAGAAGVLAESTVSGALRERGRDSTVVTGIKATATLAALRSAGASSMTAGFLAGSVDSAALKIADAIADFLPARELVGEAVVEVVESPFRKLWRYVGSERARTRGMVIRGTVRPEGAGGVPGAHALAVAAHAIDPAAGWERRATALGIAFEGWTGSTVAMRTATARMLTSLAMYFSFLWIVPVLFLIEVLADKPAGLLGETYEVGWLVATLLCFVLRRLLTLDTATKQYLFALHSFEAAKRPDLSLSGQVSRSNNHAAIGDLPSASFLAKALLRPELPTPPEPSPSDLRREQSSGVKAPTFQDLDARIKRTEAAYVFTKWAASIDGPEIRPDRESIQTAMLLLDGTLEATALRRMIVDYHRRVLAAKKSGSGGELEKVSAALKATILKAVHEVRGGQSTFP